MNDTDKREETDIEERTSVVKVSAQSSFSDSGLGGYNSDSEDIGRGKTDQELSISGHGIIVSA